MAVNHLEFRRDIGRLANHTNTRSGWASDCPITPASLGPISNYVSGVKDRNKHPAAQRECNKLLGDIEKLKHELYNYMPAFSPASNAVAAVTPTNNLAIPSFRASHTQALRKILGIDRNWTFGFSTPNSEHPSDRWQALGDESKFLEEYDRVRIYALGFVPKTKLNHLFFTQTELEVIEDSISTFLDVQRHKERLRTQLHTQSKSLQKMIGYLSGPNVLVRCAVKRAIIEAFDSLSTIEKITWTNTLIAESKKATLVGATLISAILTEVAPLLDPSSYKTAHDAVLVKLERIDAETEGANISYFRALLPEYRVDIFDSLLEPLSPKEKGLVQYMQEGLEGHLGIRASEHQFDWQMSYDLWRQYLPDKHPERLPAKATLSQFALFKPVAELMGNLKRGCFPQEGQIQAALDCLINPISPSHPDAFNKAAEFLKIQLVEVSTLLTPKSRSS